MSSEINLVWGRSNMIGILQCFSCINNTRYIVVYFDYDNENSCEMYFMSSIM